MAESVLPTINAQSCIIFPSKNPRLWKIGRVMLDNGELIAVILLRRWLHGFPEVLLSSDIRSPVSINTDQYKCKKSSQQINYLFKSEKVSSNIRFTNI